MVYHMKNWEFARDMMCSNPGLVKSYIEDTFKEIGVSLPVENKKEIDNIIRDCSCVETQEGLEACLNLSREDMAPIWKGKPGESSAFEAFLQKLNEHMGELLEDSYKKHVI